MIEIPISKKHIEFVEQYSPGQDIGGFSNLEKKDLAKASRLDFQKTGIQGELSWYIHRYNSIDKLKDLLDYKFTNLRPANKGDDGFDDSITYNNKTRFVDIKTSYCENVDRIKYLNLVVPQREMHKNMIYVCAFSIGKTRGDVDKVILAGWVIEDDIHRRWAYDSSKWCVPVSELRDMKELDVYIR